MTKRKRKFEKLVDTLVEESINNNNNAQGNDELAKAKRMKCSDRDRSEECALKSRSDVIKESNGTSGDENSVKQFSLVQGKDGLSETKKIACGDGDKSVKEKCALESEAQPELENEVIGELEVTSKGKNSYEHIP